MSFMHSIIFNSVMKSKKTYVPGTIDYDKRRKDEMEQVRFVKAPKSIRVQNGRINGIPVEKLVMKGNDKSKIIYYIHGGGFVTGSSLARRNFTTYMVKNFGLNVIIVFDSVSRMSRSADEGVQTYFELYERGVNLVFLKEHYIDTAVYAENMKDKIELQGTDEDEIFKGLNNYFRKLAEKQIRIAFEQSEKEVKDLQQRTKEGIQTAKLNGKQIGHKRGTKLKVKKAVPAKEIIMKHSKAFLWKPC